MQFTFYKIKRKSKLEADAGAKKVKFVVFFYLCLWSNSSFSVKIRNFLYVSPIIIIFTIILVGF